MMPTLATHAVLGAQLRKQDEICQGGACLPAQEQIHLPNSDRSFWSGPLGLSLADTRLLASSRRLPAGNPIERFSKTFEWARRAQVRPHNTYAPSILGAHKL